MCSFRNSLPPKGRPRLFPSFPSFLHKHHFSLFCLALLNFLAKGSQNCPFLSFSCHARCFWCSWPASWPLPGVSSTHFLAQTKHLHASCLPTHSPPEPYWADPGHLFLPISPLCSSSPYISKHCHILHSVQTYSTDPSSQSIELRHGHCSASSAWVPPPSPMSLKKHFSSLQKP